MTILLVLLVWEYASIRLELHRHPERVEETLAGEEAAARAYGESIAGARAREAGKVREAGRGRHANLDRSHSRVSDSEGVSSRTSRTSSARTASQPSEARLRAREERAAREARDEARVRRVRRAYDGVHRNPQSQQSESQARHTSTEQGRSGSSRYNNRSKLNNLPKISDDELARNASRSERAKKDGYSEIIASVDDDYSDRQ